MKRLKIIMAGMLVFSLTGCSSGSLADISVDQNGVGKGWSEGVTFNDAGVYFVDHQGELFFKEDGQSKVSLGYINYIDGKKKNIYIDGFYTTQEVYTLNSGTLEYYDGRIYALYEHQNVSGGSTYELCSLNEKGEDLRSHIIFEYYPNDFYITNGKVYVCTYDQNSNTSYITIYDSDFKEIETEEYDATTSYPSDFYIVDGEIRLPDFNTVEYDYGDVQISRRSELVEGTDNSYLITGIYDKGDVHVELENRIIAFVNDQYFYAYYFNLTDTPIEQVYERYSLDGSLDTSIRIADWLETDEEISSMDFGAMLSLRGTDQTFGFSQKGLFTCDFSDGKCEYLYDDRVTNY